MANISWRCLQCSTTQLCLETVLLGGQSFRWKQTSEKGEWLGVIGRQVWRLKQTDQHLMYQVYPPSDSLELKQMTDGACSSIGNDAIVKLEPKSESNGLALNENVSDQNKQRRQGVKRRQRSQTPSTGTKKQTTDIDPISAKVVKQESEKKELDIKLGDAAILKDYFQLDVDLENLYSYWASKDKHFANIGAQFQGIRILRQDPVENLFSFVCSSNNHISRITSMVEKLCSHYGTYITKVDGTDFYSFPSFKALSGDGVEAHLRELGFGYRAKFISSIAKHVTQEKGEDWLMSLRDAKYPEARKELMTLLGVGAKVADCVCLMSLDKSESVPVDTHVWQITMKNYMAKLNHAKSLTDKLYQEIGDFYRNLWGPYAGWAHSVLFIADLKHNKDKTDSKPVADKKSGPGSKETANSKLAKRSKSGKQKS